MEPSEDAKEGFVESLLAANRSLRAESSTVSKNYYRKLALFLKLFVNFEDASAWGQELYFNVFLDLLKKDNEAVQKLAVECMAKFPGKPALSKLKKNLLNLVQKQTFRSELLTLNLDKEGTLIPSSQRPQIIPVIVSVVYPKLFSKRSLKHKSSVETNKNIVFEFFSALNDRQELQILFDVIISSHQIPKTKSLDTLRQLPIVKQLAFLRNLKVMIHQMGKHLIPFIGEVADVLLNVLNFCQVAKLAVSKCLGAAAKSGNAPEPQGESAQTTKPASSSAPGPQGS